MNIPPIPWWGWAGLAGVFAVGLGAGQAAGAALADPGRPAGAPPALLKIGMAGPWVSFLQRKLGVAESGTFDSATESAVRAFQQARGLGVDGKVGTQTWGALGVSTAPAPSGGGAPKPQAAANSQSVSVGPAPPPPSDGSLSQNQATREQQIYDAVASGNAIVEWAAVTSEKNGHTAKILVMRRALQVHVGSGGPLIVNLSFRAHQRICDLLACCMLTTKVSDLAWEQAGLRLGVINHNDWVSDGSMGLVRRMYDQNAILQQKIGSYDGLVANEGKDWIVTKRMWTGPDTPEGTKSSRRNSCNFGWYGSAFSGRSPGGLAVAQSPGMAHDGNHTDYSQLFRCMQKTVIVDGSPMQVESVLADPVLSALVSDEGPLPKCRSPYY